MFSYFRKTDLDRSFFEEKIDARLPKTIFDMHLHLTRPSDAVHVPQESIDGDWAMQCGFVMTEEDLEGYSETLWGDRTFLANAFPMPIRGVDLMSANRHLADLLAKHRNDPNRRMTVRTAEIAIAPSFDSDECEDLMIGGGFLGYKPYPDLVSGQKGADIRIPDFLPDAFMKSLDRYRRAVTIHLPRAERIASPLNIRELLELRQKFPDAKIIIAHYGRSYNIEVIKKAYAEMGRDIEGFYFDNAAVINPEVHRFMLEHLPVDHLFYGSDMPLLLWHGRRTWENGTYQNYAREPFPWTRTRGDTPKEKETYTFFLYEQMNHLLDTVYEIGGKKLADKMFLENAETFVRQVLG